jgi:bifunctional ADP-heptose synthase (sugar kinase/adenylyltransferase)
MHKNRAPEELNRLDTKNWTPTPEVLERQIVEGVRGLANEVDALILLDQVDIAETGVVTRRVLEAVREEAEKRRELLIIADSRRSLRGFPPVSLKMNVAELGLFFNARGELSLAEIREKALALAKESRKHVFVTMAERGILGAYQGELEEVEALPVRGEIDIVGAGDSVTANLTAALSAGASLRGALEIAQLAASIVVHQVGTTGTAGVKQMQELLKFENRENEQGMSNAKE